jgi:hypothetical protein
VCLKLEGVTTQVSYTGPPARIAVGHQTKVGQGTWQSTYMVVTIIIYEEIGNKETDNENKETIN